MVVAFGEETPAVLRGRDGREREGYRTGQDVRMGDKWGPSASPRRGHYDGDSVSPRRAVLSVGLKALATETRLGGSGRLSGFTLLGFQA